jgi:DNA-binding beta-propeller fold protein YncE
MDRDKFCQIRVATAVGLAACLSFLSTKAIANPTVPNHHYHLLKKIALDGNQGWDYLTLDSAARRLYVTRGTEVVVVNVDTGSIVGKVSGTSGVHGVALAPELGRGFTSNGRTATATIFALKTLQPLGTVKTGQNPDAIVYDPFSQKVFTFNGNSNNATVFDAKSAQVLGTIPLGGEPEFAVTNGAGQIYVNIADKSEVATIDVNRLRISTRSSLKSCSEPTGIALDRSNHRLFVGCRNQKLAVVDANSGQVKTTLPIGKGVDATAFDAATKLAFSSNGEATLTVIQEETPEQFRVIDNVMTQRGARTMALDLKTHDVFLVTAQFQPLPAPVAGQPTARPKIVPGTVAVLMFGE